MESFHVTLEAEGNISLEALVAAVDDVKMMETLVAKLLEEKQEEHTLRLCGPRYGRNRTGFMFVRAGRRQRTLLTKAGKIVFRLQRMRYKKAGKIHAPFLAALGVGRYQRCGRDLKRACVELTSKTTYRDGCYCAEKTLGIKVGRMMVHRWVQEVGALIDVHNQRQVSGKQAAHLTADGTKAHGIKGAKNEVNVVLGYDPETNQKTLLKASVNRSWKQTAAEVKQNGALADDAVLVSDADKPMRNSLLGERMSYQMCNLHGIDEVRYKLWREEMPKKERDTYVQMVARVLFTLKNSVDKHLADKDYRRLEGRIQWALKELKRISKRLHRAGYCRATKFIQNSANYLVTYAKVAMKGVKLPYTSNLIERLMGEVAKRVKNKWAHWSTKGLENMINILLVRYCSPEIYEDFWREYTHQKPGIKLTLTIHSGGQEF